MAENYCVQGFRFSRDAWLCMRYLLWSPWFLKKAMICLVGCILTSGGIQTLWGVRGTRAASAAVYAIICKSILWTDCSRRWLQTNLLYWLFKFSYQDWSWFIQKNLATDGLGFPMLLFAFNFLWVSCGVWKGLVFPYTFQLTVELCTVISA